MQIKKRITLRRAVYRQSVGLGSEPLQTQGQKFFSQLNTCSHSRYIIFCLTRGWVCHLQLLLALASAFILGSESRWTRDHILLFQISWLPFLSPPTTHRATVEVFDHYRSFSTPLKLAVETYTVQRLNVVVSTGWESKFYKEKLIAGTFFLNYLEMVR
jgi:hypothetical protein